MPRWLLHHLNTNLVLGRARTCAVYGNKLFSRPQAHLSTMGDIKPFQINVPQEELDVLRKKLELSKFPDELSDAGWEVGAPLADMKRLTSYWLNGYDWRAQERKINEALPQFTTNINVEEFGTMNIHFAYKKSKTPNAIPLLFCHGWPGSFIEAIKILPDLIEGKNGAPSFDVVAPSLPGYGFSEGAKKKGFSPGKCAEVCHKLMLQLGYDQYVTQGGDWGYIVTRSMGMLYPNHCVASHLNMWGPESSVPASQPILRLRYALTPLTAAEKAGLARSKWFAKDASAYYKEHATRPQTIGYSQADSPVGLLAWIYEKLHDWTDDYPWTDDEVLTWISIYYFSRAGPTAATRLYYEAAHDKNHFRERVRGWIGGVKLGLAKFPKELTVAPRLLGRTMGPVVFESEYDRGGHFAAWERPDAIVSDLRTMFGKGGGAYGAVRGRDGYAGRGNAKL